MHYLPIDLLFQIEGDINDNRGTMPRTCLLSEVRVWLADQRDNV